MKILWLAHEGMLSGANLCLLEYATILKRRGIQIHMVVPSVRELANAATVNNIPFTEIKFYSWTVPLVDFKRTYFEKVKRWGRNRIAVSKIKQLIRAENPDFVVTNTIATPVAALAAQAAGKKHVWFVHEFGEEDHGFSISGGFKRGAAIMEKLSYKLVYNSNAVQQKYVPFVEESKRNIVFNAVMITGGYKEIGDCTPLRLIILGQVAPAKNHLEAFRALSICKKQGLRFELTVVGKAEDESYLDNLLKCAKALQIENNVKFLGEVLQPQTLIQQHHALLMCSRKEAFGRVTVEALKLGVPVVAADSGGSLEIISEGLDGLLYKSGNENNFANKILELKNNYSLFNRKQISVMACEKFNEEVSYRQLLKVFDLAHE